MSKFANLYDNVVEVHFKDELARAEFEILWIIRAGKPVDVIENGTQYMGDNAERAKDIASEIPGVKIIEL